MRQATPTATPRACPAALTEIDDRVVPNDRSHLPDRRVHGMLAGRDADVLERKNRPGDAGVRERFPPAHVQLALDVVLVSHGILFPLGAVRLVDNGTVRDKLDRRHVAYLIDNSIEIGERAKRPIPLLVERIGDDRELEGSQETKEVV